jgi:hypothetical protein
MKVRLPRLRGKKTFRLFMADAEDAPPDVWFSSLHAALRAADRLDERWKGLAWIIEYEDQASFGGIPVVRDVVHMRYGVRVAQPEAGPPGS